MGVTAILTSAADAVSRVLTPALKKIMPQPTGPDVQPPPVANDAANLNAANLNAADNAGQRARRKAIGASGRSDTILTGAQGLGAVPTDTAQAKTLLGL